MAKVRHAPSSSDAREMYLSIFVANIFPKFFSVLLSAEKKFLVGLVW